MKHAKEELACPAKKAEGKAKYNYDKGEVLMLFGCYDADNCGEEDDICT